MNKLLIALLAGLVLGCGVSTGSIDEDTSAEVVEGEAELSANTYSFATLRHDQRKCMAPRCGGYWVKDVNASTAEQYVSGLSFLNGSLGTLGREQLTSAPDGEVIVRARLGAIERRFNTRKLIVHSAWRGLPGKTVEATDGVFTIDRLVTACLPNTACPQLKGQALNGPSTERYAERLSVERAAAGQLSRDWLEAQVLDEDTLVAGRFVSARKPPARAVTAFEASNLFVRLGAQWSCPAFRLAPCPNGGTWTYQYASTGCIVPDRCVTAGACAAVAPPACAAGYRTLTFDAGPFACSSQVCEPEFPAVNPR